MMADDEVDDSDPMSADDGHKPEAYGCPDYWDDRYATWAQKPFDWLFTYADIASFITAFYHKTDAILIPGCGNAPFSPDLFDAGYRKQRCVDLSAVVINQQKVRHADRCKQGLVFEIGDCMALDYEDCTFDGVIDKSLIDTLMCLEHANRCVNSFLSEMSRLVKPGGFCMFLSLHSEKEVLKMVAPEHPKISPFGWVVSSVSVAQPSQAKDPCSTYSITICKKWAEGNDIDDASTHGAGLAAVKCTRRRAKPAMASANLSRVGRFGQCKTQALPSDHELAIAKLALDKQMQTANKGRSATRTVDHKDTLNPMFYGWALVMTLIIASIVYALCMIYSTLERMAQIDRSLGRQTISIAIMDGLAYFRHIYELIRRFCVRAH